MEHSHHDGHEPKKKTAWFAYIAAFVLIGGFLTFINCMNCCSKSCSNHHNTESHGEGHGESHGEEHGGGEHH